MTTWEFTQISNRKDLELLLLMEMPSFGVLKFIMRTNLCGWISGHFSSSCMEDLEIETAVRIWIKKHTAPIHLPIYMLFNAPKGEYMNFNSLPERYSYPSQLGFHEIPVELRKQLLMEMPSEEDWTFPEKLHNWLDAALPNPKFLHYDVNLVTPAKTKTLTLDELWKAPIVQTAINSIAEVLADADKQQLQQVPLEADDIGWLGKRKPLTDLEKVASRTPSPFSINVSIGDLEPSIFQNILEMPWADGMLDEEDKENEPGPSTKKLRML